VDSSGGAVENYCAGKARAPRLRSAGTRVTKGVEPGPADDDIPLAGDASVLWTTDDAALELPGLCVASQSCAGDDSSDALMHGNSYV
jgi:hypothetical protein